MTDFAFTITRGDSRQLELTVTRGGAAENLAGAKLWFTAKAQLADPISAAKIRKSTGALGGITVTGAAAGEARVTLDPADTASLAAPAILFADVQLQTGGGNVETIATGTLTVTPDVTNSTTE